MLKAQHLDIAQISTESTDNVGSRCPLRCTGLTILVPTFSTFVNIKAKHRTKEPQSGLMLKQTLKPRVSVMLVMI